MSDESNAKDRPAAVAYYQCSSADRDLLAQVARQMLYETDRAFDRTYRTYGRGMPFNHVESTELGCGTAPGITLIYDMMAHPDIAADVNSPQHREPSGDFTTNLNAFNLRVESHLLRDAVGRVKIRAEQTLHHAGVDVPVTIREAHDPLPRRQR